MMTNPLLQPIEIRKTKKPIYVPMQSREISDHPFTERQDNHRLEDEENEKLCPTPYDVFPATYSLSAFRIGSRSQEYTIDPSGTGR